MKRVSLASCFVLAMTWTAISDRPATAAPINDPSAWAQQFEQLALKTDLPAMLKAVEDVADPRFKTEAISGLFDSVGKLLGGKTGSYAEQFAEKDLGTFMKRINVAVIYDNYAIFYSVVFVRTAEGWQILGFAVDGNVNHILALEWPG